MICEKTVTIRPVGRDDGETYGTGYYAGLSERLFLESVEEFRAGKEKAFNALIGQAMKASRGKANPAQLTELLKQKLAG